MQQLWDTNKDCYVGKHNLKPENLCSIIIYLSEVHCPFMGKIERSDPNVCSSSCPKKCQMVEEYNNKEFTGWQMVNSRLCETVRLDSVFLCETETFGVFRLWDRDWDSKMEFAKKNWDCETYRTAQKTRLQDLWNLTKILQFNLFFLKTIRHPFTTCMV